MKKRIAILGSTGSIGTQTLDVIQEQSEYYEVEVLTAYSNADLLIQQAIQFQPNAVVIGEENKYNEVFSALSKHDIKVYSGSDALAQIVEMDTIDIVLSSCVGYSGLEPTIRAIKAGKQIALANKEVLVVAGELITKLLKENKTSILPVDSEHSAILQCLTGELENPIEKIYLTASGGPFFGKDRKFLEQVTKEDALKHPNWTMGNKVTIDSASMMNKGLEVIEAKWLFDLEPEQIDVIIHPQSIVHSLVQFEDGSLKAQMGLPDMKLPIQYALSFPRRLKSSFKRFNFLDYKTLNFEAPDTTLFPSLNLAYEALRQGGNMACIMNAANEIVVQEFLNDNISFLQIPTIIEQCMSSVTFIQSPKFEDYVATDKEARAFTKSLI